jgi:hypothetical protein
MLGLSWRAPCGVSLIHGDILVCIDGVMEEYGLFHVNLEREDRSSRRGKER